MKNSLNVILIIAIIALASSLIIKPKQEAATPEADNNQLANQEEPVMNDSKKMTKPEMMIDSAKTYSVTLKTTEGDITIELDAKGTPITANNFYYLAKEGFYDNVIFHRVISGFMIQGGDPTGTGMGDPGYKFDDEEFEGEYTRGTVAMANSGPNTNGSQFFIMHADYALPPNYVIFGHVTSGLDVVDKIAAGEVTGDRPNAPVTISSVLVDEK